MRILNYIVFGLSVSFLIITLHRVIKSQIFKIKFNEGKQCEDADENNISKSIKGNRMQLAGLLFPSVAFLLLILLALLAGINGIFILIATPLMVIIPLMFMAGLFSSISSIRYVDEKILSITGLLINAFFLLMVLILIIGARS